ncbi:MAG: AAA family ATPase [Bacilli bacterium]|nr:AAA family ATPase [Bacilli bacterium]
MYAILMKKKKNEQDIEIIEPYALLNGILDSNGLFYSKGIKYELISISSNDGYAFPIEEQQLKEMLFPNASDFEALDCSQISKLYFFFVKLFNYIEFNGDYYASHKRVASMEKSDFSKPFGCEEKRINIVISTDKIRELYEKIEKSENKEKKEPSGNFEIKKVYNYITSSLIGQTSQVKQILALIAKNQIISNPRLKSNLLIYGPAGVGKTEVFRLISECSDVPVVIEDITGYTKAGYVGHDVEEIVYKLLVKADFDIQKTVRGIIVIDEIDKKVATNSQNSISSTDVLYALLKLIEGTSIKFKGKNGEVLTIDTSFITFVFCGNFENIRVNNNNVSAIGFERNRQIVDDNITTEQLQKYGLPLELLRRVHAEIKFNPLTLENLKQILQNSKNSMLKLYAEMFKNSGVSLSYTETVIEAIAREAYKNRLGASSLNRVIDDILKDAMFEIFYSDCSYSKLVISDDPVLDDKRYRLF